LSNSILFLFSPRFFSTPYNIDSLRFDYHLAIYLQDIDSDKKKDAMLKTKLLYPQILEALGKSGHGAQVLIADGNFPFSVFAPARAAIVYLNLKPGLVTVTDVIAVLVDTIPVESAIVMVPQDGTVPSIFDEFKHLLPPNMELTPLGRFEFYQQVTAPQTTLIIATGEQRINANLLPTIGVIKD
jgi:L-fucose mutarotase